MRLMRWLMGLFGRPVPVRPATRKEFLEAVVDLARLENPQRELVATWLQRSRGAMMERMVGTNEPDAVLRLWTKCQALAEVEVFVRELDQHAVSAQEEMKREANSRARQRAAKPHRSQS